MKKTLLATAIAGTMAATGAQAATVYDQDGTSLDLYGRLVYGLTTGGPDPDGDGNKSSGSSFDDLGSRFGFIANHEVTSDMSVFARMEFRGDADAQNDDGFETIRNTYVGVKSNSWGSVQAGNFDSVYYRSGDVLFDIPENEGWTQIGGISADSRGDAISYSTPDLSGFRAHVQAKHLSGNGDVEPGEDNSATWSTAAAVDYTISDLYLSLGYSQGKDVSGRGAEYDGGTQHAAGEDLVGFFTQYEFTDAFSARFKYEQITDTYGQADLIEREGVDAGDAMETVMGIGASYDYGMGEIYGDYYRVEMALDEADDEDRWVLGANYRFSEPMYVFAEAYQRDSSIDVEDDTISDAFRSVDDDVLYTMGVRYDF